MNYRIEKKEAFRIVGLSAPMKSNTEENFSVVPQLWGRAAEEGWIGKLAAMMNAQPMGILASAPALKMKTGNTSSPWRAICQRKPR